MNNFIDNLKDAYNREIVKMDIRSERHLNYKWVLANKTYMLDTYPTLWVVITKEVPGQSNLSLDYLMKSLRNQGLDEESNLYVFCDEYHFNIMTEYSEYDV